MSDQSAISFGDNVVIVASPTTEELGYARAPGQVWGVTTPSVTKVVVIGESDEDLAFNIHFENIELEDAWFVPALVEFVDHGAGTEIRIGDARLTRSTEGEWEPGPASP